jgi:5-methyltetrahydrofolate--homocysteine methyltransferase
MNMSDFIGLQKYLIAGDGERLAGETQKLLDSGIDPHAIIKEGLVPGMDVVGEKFKNDELYLPEVINIATIFKSSVELVKPKLMSDQVAFIGKVVIGTVQGDMHDVGKNIVVLMLEANGFEVIDLGVDVSSQTFIKTASESEADVIGMSALLTTTMPKINEVVHELKEAGLEGKFRTIIGGAPINQSFADDVGVDAYGHDAIDAVEKIKGLLDRNA